MSTGTVEGVVKAAENARKSGPKSRTRRLSPADFPGCRLVPMTYGDYAASERRLALWDADSETAVEAREAMGRIHSRAASLGSAGLQTGTSGPHTRRKDRSDARPMPV